MKASIIIVSCIGVALVAGTVVHLSGPRAPLDSTPVVEPASETLFTRPARMNAPSEESQQRVAQQPMDEPAQVVVVNPVPSHSATATTADSDPPPTPFSRAIETLVSSQATFQQKQAAWGELRETGQLDQAIEALKRGASDNPTTAGYPAALGQAQLRKADVISHNGGTISEMGIMGMQADQNFDAALKLDPANWEAQFFKATAMSYWPLELNKGDEVIQRLSRLIDQQETMAPQPQFAQTYVMLGDQYQKMDYPDYATATWQLGAAKFPGDPALQIKIRGQ